jgi:hypothetical protein
MNLFPNEQNFDPDKSRQKFHHGLNKNTLKLIYYMHWFIHILLMGI